MNFIFPTWTPPHVGIYGTDAVFPVRRVHCVAKNYTDHIREMGGDPDRVKPKFFSKSAHAVLAGEKDVFMPYPKATEDLHYEAELVVALGEDGKIFGYGVGIDFTKRDVQAEAKASAMPWDTSKNFANAAVVSWITPLENCPDVQRGRVTLHQNGDLKQDGDLGQMIYDIAEIMQHLEGYDDLLSGDLIFTGTPAGVGACQKGDVLRVEVAGLPPLNVHIE